MTIGRIRKTWLGNALDAMTAERDGYAKLALTQGDRAEREARLAAEVERRLHAIRRMHRDVNGSCPVCSEWDAVRGVRENVAYPCETARVSRGGFA